MPHLDRQRTRLQDFDYSSDGAYFITICVQDRQQVFGKIVNDEMILNESGRIAEKCWQDIPAHFPDAKIDEFVVMPNHVHGIIQIEKSHYNQHVGNRHAYSLPRNTQLIPNIIGSFKSSVMRIIRKQIPSVDFRWQSSFHDRIIRDEKEMNAYQEYIRNNPLNWAVDRENALTLQSTHSL